jgi:hypothetical protein
MFKRISHFCPHQVRWIQSTFFHHITSRSSSTLFPTIYTNMGLPTKFCMHLLFPSCVPHSMHLIIKAPLIWSPSYYLIKNTDTIMKHLIMQLSQLPFTSTLWGSNIPLSTLFTDASIATELQHTSSWQWLNITQIITTF